MKRKAINLSELDHRKLFSKNNEELSSTAVLSDVLGFKDIFVHHEIIPPGKRTSLPHYHTKKEEMIIVLKGTPTVMSGGLATELKPGDFIGFLPNSKIPHFIKNDSNQIAEVLVITSNPEDDQVVFA